MWGDKSGTNLIVITILQYIHVKLKINKRHFIYWNLFIKLFDKYLYWASKSIDAYVSFWEQKSESWGLEGRHKQM